MVWLAVQVNLTYEGIFDALMREKGREELQKLDESFFGNVAAYIQSKHELISLDEDNKEKILIQVQNIRRMLRELYERREKKIVNMAVAASRTSPGFIDTSNMLMLEKSLFDGVLQQLDYFRKSVLNSALHPKPPTAQAKPQQAPIIQDEEDEEDGFRSASEIVESLMPKRVASPAQSMPVKSVIMTQAVHQFVGKELEVYGPYIEGQAATLPAELADILVSRGSAVPAEQTTSS
ncbi:hypothetical protein HY640_00345 [Candidatus Woesearchaeota archaeon]|nr:hypothetical protein [Candidatus Woesearchaeota archaeon]